MRKTEFYCRGSEIVHRAKNSMALEYIADHRGGVIKWKEHRIREQETRVLFPCLTQTYCVNPWVSIWASVSSSARKGNKSGVLWASWDSQKDAENTCEILCPFETIKRARD